ncbi:TPA: toll/interleukin-1 receptor domain-containing protein [Stenotrophomonas maltophilia]
MEARSRGIRTAFLCHSHKDQDLVKGFVRMLHDSGWSVYVDWNDSSMPSTPNETTARKIREKIVQLDYFIFLATENSMGSRWCPWELGCADGKKPNERILVVPTSEHGRDHGNEYIGLYRRIDQNSLGDIQVYSPGISYGTAVRSL